MSITDELREWAVNHRAELDMGQLYPAMIERIADRIDAKHDEIRDFCERLEGAATDREDVTLWGVDYTALPLDADGEYIHVGDVMEERSGHTFEVASLMAFGGSGNWLALSNPRNFSSFREPHDIRHHHAPTVEDVLREFADGWDFAEGAGKGDSYMKTFAAKLQLAGDAE